MDVHNPPGLTKFVVQRMVQAHPFLQKQTTFVDAVQRAHSFSDLSFVVGAFDFATQTIEK